MGATTAAIWADRRLGCVVAGTPAVVPAPMDDFAGDTSYTVVQAATTDDGRDALSAGASSLVHVMTGVVCVRGQSASADPGPLSAGLVAVFQLASPAPVANTYWPSGFGSTTLSLRDGVATVCDPATHPVILDRATVQVLSVNPSALSHVVAYEAPAGT